MKQSSWRVSDTPRRSTCEPAHSRGGKRGAIPVKMVCHGVHRASAQLREAPAEQLLRRGVHGGDQALRVQGVQPFAHGGGDRFAEVERVPQVLLRPLAARDVAEGDAALPAGDEALGFEVHDPALSAWDRELEVAGLLERAREDPFEEGGESGALLRGEHPAQGLTHQPGALDAEQDGARQVRLQDPAVLGEGEVAHGREVVEVGVLLQQPLQVVSRREQLLVLAAAAPHGGPAARGAAAGASAARLAATVPARRGLRRLRTSTSARR